MNKIIKFGAEWCQPCKVMQPHFDSFKESKSDGAVEIQAVDVDENRDLVKEYGIRSIPTTIFIKGGTEVERVTGMQSTDALLEKYKVHYEN
jgi:thioredoxin 1